MTDSEDWKKHGWWLMAAWRTCGRNYLTPELDAFQAAAKLCERMSQGKLIDVSSPKQGEWETIKSKLLDARSSSELCNLDDQTLDALISVASKMAEGVMVDVSTLGPGEMVYNQKAGSIPGLGEDEEIP